MGTYDRYAHRAQGIAFIAGPLIMLAAAALWLLGVGANPPPFDWSSSWEGAAGVYSIVMFIVIYLELARLLGQHSPRFGIVCAATGLMGCVGGAGAYYMRMFVDEFAQAGATTETMEAVWFTSTGPELAGGLIALFFPVTAVLAGIGLLRAKTVSTWTAAMLIVGGVCFLIAQAAEFQMEIFYPLAAFAWLIGVGPLGWRYLTENLSGEQSYEEAVAQT